MKTGNVFCLMAVVIFFSSVCAGNAAYTQRGSLQKLPDDSILLQQNKNVRLNNSLAHLTSSEKSSLYWQEYCEARTDPAGEQFRHRHQLKKGANETPKGNQNQKGSGGKRQKGSGGANRGGGRK